MTTEGWIEFPCLTVLQPFGTFYCGVMSGTDLIAISYADIRRIGSGLDDFLGFQRKLSETRVKEIKNYVKTIDASFPTSIILAVKNEDVRYDEDTRVMALKRAQGVAVVIDGQHRIAGLAESALAEEFQSIVTLFIDLDIEDQANLFATINLKQTKVNRSLALDLLAFARSRSPQRTAHDVAVVLNGDSRSPLFRKVMRLGVATEGVDSETITQALLVDELLKLISTNPMADRDAVKRKRPILRDANWRRLPFRNVWIDNEDDIIVKNVWNLFAAVAAKWPTAWVEPRPGIILNRNTGVWVLLNFLGDVYRRVTDAEKEVISQRTFADILERMTLQADDLNSTNFPSGSPGRSKLRAYFTAALNEHLEATGRAQA